MTDRPILFSAPMVRALLDGRKSQTRRMAWREPKFDDSPFDRDLRRSEAKLSTVWQSVKPGDRLWVRETWNYVNAIGAPAQPTDVPKTALYAADPRGVGLYKWRPSIHMPRWASRLTLIVTDTRLERVQDISESDARAEGVLDEGWEDEIPAGPVCTGFVGREAFRSIWAELHGPDAWDRNDEVVALTFTVHKRNIAQMSEAA